MLSSMLAAAGVAADEAEAALAFTRDATLHEAVLPLDSLNSSDSTLLATLLTVSFVTPTPLRKRTVFPGCPAV